MKWNWKNNLLLIILLFAGACTKETAGEQAVYTCPMHPTVLSDVPGTCPVCGMDLVPKARPGEETTVTHDLAHLLKSPNEVVITAVKTIKPQFKSVPVSVQASGAVTYDPRRIYTIAARVGGRIENVYVKYAFQRVKQGQKVADIYSPELIAAQRELVYLVENDPGNEALIRAAKGRLQLLGVQDFQIRNLVKQKIVGNVFSVYSPYDGYVIGKDFPSEPALPGSFSSGGTPDSRQQDTGVANTFLREGDYISRGETLFTIANTNALRIALNVPETWSTMIHKGDRVELQLAKETKKTAVVDLVQPFFNGAQNFLQVRVYVHDTRGLYVDQLVDATISTGAREALWLPQESVLDLGNEQIVFIHENEILKPAKVTTGITAGNLVEIKSGLASSQEVAENAHFLTGNESIIKPDNGL